VDATKQNVTGATVVYKNNDNNYKLM